ERLRRARERFDEATIDTIHGFCQRVLQHSGAELGVDPSSELRDDVDDIARTVVNDLLVRSVRHAEPGWFRLLDDEIRGDGDLADRLVRVVRTVAGRPYLQLRPDDETDPAAAWSGVCGAFREAWRAESDILIDWINRTQQDRGFRSKTAYTPAVIERLRDDVDAWCAMASPPLGGALPDIDALAWVTRHAIDAALVEPTDVPEGLVVVDRAAEVIELRVRVATLFVRRFVTEAVAELDRRTADAGVWTFDDLLIVLDRALADPRRAGVVTAAIRQRFSAALIDEFQDTDPIQWRIFSALFGDDEGRLLLIGDPKQAIYGFRGADIRTYLQAVTGTDEGNRWTLEVNHRSDQRFLDALERLFLRDDVGDEGVFAVPDIRFRQVRATELHQTDGLTYQGDPRPALEIRVATRDQFSTDEGDPIALGRVRPVLPRYVAQEIDELLHSDVHFVNRTGPAAGDGGAVHRMLRPGDIAVLTRTRRQATQVQDALRARGISAVVGVDESVLDSPEAVAVERFLAAMNAAPDERAARAAAASSIVGMTASVFAEADSDAWDGFMTDVARWTAQWRTDGVAAALRTAMVERTTAARLLSLQRGERAVTNLVHLIEVLHVEETVAGRGPAALLEWLADQRHRPDRRADALELRLENDADA
ncbi:MAG: UvrD-helicase domain-containing protein, partial [Nitriliruptoraceae bacterium]